MIPRQITMSLDKRNRDCKTCQHGKAELFSSSGQSPLIFYPLDNRDPLLLVNYQKVSLLEESQEVGMKWGLGRSVSFISVCNILAYNTLRLRDQNRQMSRGSKIIHIPEKQKSRNTV